MIIHRYTGNLSALSLLCFAVLANVPQVHAQDMDWNGFYIGGYGQFASVDARYGDPYDGHIGARFSDADSQGFSASGGGGQIGYLQQNGNIVFGAEIFAEYTNASDCLNTNEQDVATGCPYGHSIETKIGETFGIDGKVGFSANKALIYGLAGVSIAKATTTYNDWTFVNSDSTYDIFDVDYFDTIDTHTEHLVGLRVGAGAEVMATRNVSFFLQGVYTRYQEMSFLARDLTYMEGDEDTGVSTRLGTLGLNLGVNFRF